MEAAAVAAVPALLVTLPEAPGVNMAVVAAVPPLPTTLAVQ